MNITLALGGDSKGEEVVEAALPEIKKIFAWRKRLRRAIGV